MSVSEMMGVNGTAVCDCGNRTFFVGLVIRGRNNAIRTIECAKCKKQVAVPFFSTAELQED